ncbi:MAG: hypothetical protein NT004_03925 [Bacteroidetes bacterium]|nr:hypothetical protein [Bacteroidota bacterium]
MKKVAIIGILLAFLLNILGFNFVFRYNQHCLHSEMTTHIKSGSYQDAMVILKILHPESNRNFRRVEKSEFTWFGKLYDVVVERKSGDTTFFYCLHDKKEETLLANFSLFLIRSGHGATTHQDKPIRALLHNLITQALIHNTPIQIPEQVTTFHFPVINAPIFPIYLVHLAPPPKSA